MPEREPSFLSWDISAAKISDGDISIQLNEIRAKKKAFNRIEFVN
jgi:hypothetical protein